MIKVCVVWVLASFVSAVSYAQSTMGVFIEEEEGTPPLRISELKMDVQIVGDRVVTNLDFTFRNQLNRVLEGEFRLPLQQGQSVYRFALDIDKEMREASIVDANKGRQTFEQIVREGVDPALLEASKGNTYKAKIYPIPSTGIRRVSIGIEEPLKTVASEHRYSMPFDFSGLVDTFELTINSDRTEKPTAALSQPDISFVSTDSGHTAKLKQSNFASGQSLEIRFPQIEKKELATRIERDSLTGEIFFRTEIPTSAQTIKPIKSVSVLWDQSLSGQYRANKQDIDFLLSYLKTSKIEEIELISFAIESSESIRYKNTEIDRAELSKELSNMVYDGATYWKAIDFSRITSDQILLFSDGIATLGMEKKINPTSPIYAINSAKAADHDFLEHLCEKSGGSYVNRTFLNMEISLEKLRTSRTQIIDTKILSGEVTDLKHGVNADDGNVLWISGKLLSDDAKLEISYGSSPTQTESETIGLDKQSARDLKGVIRRSWAKSVFEDFDILSKTGKSEASSFAQRHGIVTSLTSLIVLESVEDYVRFEIEPPTHLLKEYKAKLAQKREDEPFDPAEKLDYVADEFAKRIAWYEREFPNKPIPRSPPKPSLIRQRGVSGNFSNVDIPTVAQDDDEEVFELSPFMVDAAPGEGYRATNTLAGTRLRTELRDVGSAISVVTEEFMNDTAIQNQGREGRIKIARWTPDAPYYRALQEAKDEDLTELYLSLRSDIDTTAFFFDVATVFFERGFAKDAIRIVSNICESRPGEYIYLRAMGRRMIQFDAGTLAIEALAETLWQRDFEPQSYFDLGLAYDAAGEPLKALQSLYRIVEMEVDDRFDEIEIIAVMEINRILALTTNKQDTSFIDPRLIYPMPMDLRITLSWNTDDTDIDLWVIDPFEEKCFYSHNLTSTGGLISHDITQGFGPEEFSIKNGAVGDYLIQANYYGSNEQGVDLPAILSAKITRNFSRANEESQTITVRLKSDESVVDIGRISIGEPIAQNR